MLSLLEIVNIALANQVFRAFLGHFDAFVPCIEAGRLAVWLIWSYLPVS